MNEVLKAIEERRSIRSYENRQISDDELEKVLNAGKFAASASGRQSALFVAVQNPAMIKKLSKMNAEIMGADTDPFYGAPTVVLVFADSSHNTHVEDGSCAMENMMIAAHAVGLGSCWIHREKQMFESEEGKMLKKEWGIPESCVGIGACILGYPACEHPSPAPRKDNFVIYVK